MHLFIQQFINGLSSGAIYALIAVGYTMVYGVLRMINFAHGDVYMIGAMTAVYVAGGALGSSHGFPFFPATLSPLDLLKDAVIGGVAVAAFVFFSGASRWMRNLQPGSGFLTWIAARMAWFLKAFAEVLLFVVLIGQSITVGGALMQRIGLPSWGSFAVVVLVAMVVGGALGRLIELIAYRPLRNRPRIASLITAIGVSMFLEYGGQGFFGATPRTLPHIVPIEGRTLDVAGISISCVSIMIVVVTLVLMGILTWIVQRTRTGMALRAVSYRFDTAALMGIDIDRIVSFTFVLGSVLAAAAGVLVAVRAPKVEPLMGLMPGIKAFVAAVLGGIGNIPGAVAGGLLLGLVEVLVDAYLPQGSQYQSGIAFVVLIAILLVKPNGLFGRNIVEKV